MGQISGGGMPQKSLSRTSAPIPDPNPNLTLNHNPNHAADFRGEECPINHYRAPDPNSNVTVNPNPKQVADIGGRAECPVMWLANRRCLVPGNDRRYRGVQTAKYPVPQTAKSTSQYTP